MAKNGWKVTSPSAQGSSSTQRSPRFIDIMSENLIENILKDEQEEQVLKEELEKQKLNEKYVYGPLDEDQLAKAAALVEILGCSQAYAEAALRRQEFSLELAADFFFLNMDSFDQYVSEDLSFNFGEDQETFDEVGAENNKDSDDTNADDVNRLEEEPEAASLPFNGFKEGGDTSSSTSSHPTASEDNEKRSDPSQASMADEASPSISSDECVARALQEMYDSESQGDGSVAYESSVASDPNRKIKVVSRQEFKKISTLSPTAEPSNHFSSPVSHSSTYQEAMDLKNDLVRYYDEYHNEEAILEKVVYDESSELIAPDYSNKNSQVDMALFRGKVTVTHSGEIVSKHDPLLQGLENSKSLSGLYGVGDLVGSQILIKNTEANAIKTFTKKLDNAYKNKK